MCGIDFSNDFPKLYPLRFNIVKDTKYRGPDLSKNIVKENLFFGFNYLSITGTHKGSPQPFIRNNNILIFNGEIYNFSLLKDNLLKKKIQFKTDGDTEVLAACLEYYGIKKTHELLEGMWSFIYYDTKKKVVTISRDRLGIKPLFYSKKKNKYFFSSSIETVRKYFLNNSKININQVIKYLKKGSIFESKSTIYNNIKLFPPGNYCQIKKNKFIFTKYWNLNNDEKFGNSSFKKFNQIINKNILKHNNYNVKTAIPLSSGVDSNYLLKNFKKNKNLICYSLKNYENDNESDVIKNKIIKKYKISHRFVDCKKFSTKNKINNFIKMLDYPIRSFQPIYQYLLREYAKKDKVKILLSGDGADEVFGGYKYAVPYRVSSLILDNQLSKAKKFCNEMEEFTGQKAKVLFLHGKKLSKKKMTLKKFLKKRILKTHIPYWLYIDDFLSMKHSIENRVPYLDSKLIDHVFQWKEDYFFKNGKNKYLLRKHQKFKTVSKQKFHKPGNYSFVYSILSKDIKKVLVNKFFSTHKQLKNMINNYTRDLYSKNQKNADLWFRVYLFSKWRYYKKI